MSCSGIHCSGCAGGGAVPVVVLAALEGFAWVAAHVIEVAAVSAACGALAVYAVVALMRRQERREAVHAARGTLLVTRPDAAPLPPARQRAALPPVINNYFYVADPAMGARVIRAIPGPAGAPSPKGKHHDHPHRQPVPRQQRTDLDVQLRRGEPG